MRRIRRTNRTILIVVEGATEEALLKHLKNLYCHRDLQVSATVRNAHGKGPQGIIDKIESCCKTADYMQIFAVLDGDIAICQDDANWLKRKGVDLFVSTPCIEATLFQLHGVRHAASTKQCKRALEQRWPGDPTEVTFYERHFPRDLIDHGRLTAPMINDLLIAITTTPIGGQQ